MFPQWNEQFITYIGVVAQTSSIFLLTLMFLLLLRISDRRGYFSLWVAAWMAKSVALLALIPYIQDGRFTLSVFAPEAPGWAPLSAGLYAFFTLLFLGFLVSGVLLFSRQVSIRRLAPWLLSGMALYTLILVLTSANVLDLAAWLALPTVLVSLYCAQQLHLLPRQRRSLGTRIVMAGLLLFALTWVGYFLAFRHMAVEDWHSHGGWRLMLTQYNGFVDLLVEVVLAIGMVLILLEDTIRELRSAYRELGASHEELQREAFFDPLTGALNRRAFDEGFSLELAQASFGTIAMIDVDGLKPVNDRFGHAAGDRLLKSLVKRLQEDLRPTDKLFRWGGDEFLLILPRSDPQLIESRLRLFLEKAGDVTASSKGERVPLSASVGTASYQGGEDFDRAIRVADEAMYAEKRRRKNGGEGDSGPRSAAVS